MSWSCQSGFSTAFHILPLFISGYFPTVHDLFLSGITAVLKTVLWCLGPSSAPCRPELRLMWTFSFWSVKIVRMCFINQQCFHPTRIKMAGSQDIIWWTLSLSCILYFQPFYSCSFPLIPDTFFCPAVFLNPFTSSLYFSYCFFFFFAILIVLSVSLFFLSPSLSIILFYLFPSSLLSLRHPGKPRGGWVYWSDRRKSVCWKRKRLCITWELSFLWRSTFPRRETNYYRWYYCCYWYCRKILYCIRYTWYTWYTWYYWHPSEIRYAHTAGCKIPDTSSLNRVLLQGIWYCRKTVHTW